jgi:hypothetical protein
MCKPIDRLLTARLIAPLLIALFAAAPAAADLDVVFVLDTTGSMGGEIREVQERVRQLAVSLARAREGELLRYGIVAYRDRGDEYVTLPFDLSDDVGAAEGFLSSLRANGGGDGPESVVAALAAGLHEMSWDRSDDVERQIFLIGDAPPHLDYHGEPTPDELIDEARRARIVINAIGCRSLPPQGVTFFRSLAYATEGSYQHIGRVEAARTGALTEALGRSVIAASDAADGRELMVAWLAHTETDSTGILVRQGGPGGVGQSRDGDGLDPCTLEIRLPPGYALRHPPLVRLGSDRLWVELVLTEGPGGRELYSLSECPPASTPISVVLGGE